MLCSSCADAAAIPLETLGAALEHHPLFPERANISFAQIVARDDILLRVWERGTGATKACGSAACATARRRRPGGADRAARACASAGRRSPHRLAGGRSCADDRAGRIRIRDAADAGASSKARRRERLAAKAEVVTFGCRLNMRRFGGAARARTAARQRDGHRQHLRRHRRGDAAGAAGDPPPASRATRGARSSSPAARRASIRKASPPWTA